MVEWQSIIYLICINSTEINDLIEVEWQSMVAQTFKKPIEPEIQA